MLEQINRLTPETSNIIIYANSATLQAIIKDTLKSVFGVEKNHNLSASTTKDYKEAKRDTMVPPFGGGLWFIDVNTEKIPIKEIKSQMQLVSNACVTVYWVDNYVNYKKITELEEVKKQGVYCKSFYFGRLEPEDITYLYDRIVPDSNRMSKELLNFVKKNYTYDVQNVCDLFTKLKSGETVKTTKEIISLIGIGGNTIDSFVIKLLSTNPKTEKGLKKSLETLIQLLADLNYTYTYTEIKRLMMYVIDGIVDMKQLQIMGLYSRVRKEIPEHYSDKATRRLNRLKRFEGTILDSINLPRVLNLKFSMQTYDSYDSQTALVQSLLMYLSNIQKSNEMNPESKEVKQKYRKRF